MEGFRYIRWLPLPREKQKPNARTRFSKSLNLTLCISPINRRFSSRFLFISSSKIVFALSHYLSYSARIFFRRSIHLHSVVFTGFDDLLTAHLIYRHVNRGSISWFRRSPMCRWSNGPLRPCCGSCRNAAVASGSRRPPSITAS